MTLSKDVVIRMLGDSKSAQQAIKSAADAAEVSVSTYRRLEREAARSQAAERAALQARRQAMQEVGQTATVMGAAMLVGFAVAAKAAAEFDKAMSAASAATSANAEQQEQLREAALQAGASTAFSATEAADAITELGKAGVSTADILGGGLAGALDLAAAGQLDVATAAGIAATQMEVFGLSGQSTSHVADLLAAGAGKAMGSVENLAGALKYVGPVAAGMGVSIEETTGALALFASNGILGEQAGTSLRGVLSALTSPSKAAATQMEALGISVFDAHGEFIGLDGVAGQLQGAMSDLTEEERSAALGRMFGNEQLTAARVLYTSGTKGVQEWTKAVNDSGYAQEQAAKLTDNLAGDLERLGGALSTALIEGGSGANDALRWLTKAATGAVDAFTDLPGPLQGVSVGFLGVTGAGTALLGIVGTMIPRIAAARESLAGLGAAGDLANRGVGVIGKAAGYASLAAVGFGLLHGAVSLLSDPIEIVTQDTDVLVNKLTELGTAADNVTAKAADFDLGRLASQLAMVTENADGMRASLRDMMPVDVTLLGVDDPVEKSWEQAKVAIEETDAALSSMLTGGRPEAAVAAFNRIADAAGFQGVGIDALKEKFPGYVAALETYVGQSTYTVDASGNVTNALGEQSDAADVLKEAWDRLNGIGTDIVTAQADWTLGLASLKQEAEGASYSLDINTEAGARNSQTLVGVAEDARNLAAAIGNRDGYDAGIAAAADFRQSLIDQAVAAGYNRGEVETLMTSIFNLDNTNSTSDLIANDQVSPAVAAARQQLKDLDGTGATVTITTINRILNARPVEFAGDGGSLPGLPRIPPRASGGPVWPDQTFLVGEQGPELVQFNGYGNVVPAGETARILASMQQPSTASPALAFPGSGGGGGSSSVSYSRTYSPTVTVATARPMDERRLVEFLADEEFLHG